MFLEYLESCSACRMGVFGWSFVHGPKKLVSGKRRLLLSAMITIMTFEINRVYYYWYGERRPHRAWIRTNCGCFGLR